MDDRHRLASGGRQHGLPRVFATLGVVLLIGLAGAAGEARAGTYKLYSCNVPGRALPPMSELLWHPMLAGPDAQFFDNCALGGGFGITLGPGRSLPRHSNSGFELRRPESGSKSAVGIVGYRTWVDADLRGSGAPVYVGYGGNFAPPGGSRPDDAPWVSPPFPTTNPVVYISLYCSAGAPDDCHLTGATPLTVRGIETDLYENVIPGGYFDGGTLLSGDLQRGSRTVRYTAVDEESGVARVELLLGSAVVATDDLDADTSICPHVDFRACPPRYGAEFSIDTSKLAEGDYVATLRVTDAAGNSRSIKRPGVVAVGRAAPPADPPTRGASTLSAQFAANGHATYTRSYARAVRVRGRLTDAGGRPIAGGRVVVTQKRDSGGATTTRSVTTGVDGRYAYRIAGSGPSRRIAITYEGSSSAMPATAPTLRLRVRAAASLHISLRGVTVRYSGTVVARPLPRRGKRIYLEGRAKGGVWQRFAARRTSARGRFSGRYRLRVRRPGVRLQFRVKVPRETGYPYQASTGRAVTKIVR